MRVATAWQPFTIGRIAVRISARENAGVDCETARRFVREIVVADFEEGRVRGISPESPQLPANWQLW